MYSVMNFNNIIPKNGIIRFKVIYKHVKEFLRYYLFGAVK
jgi:hypothetical protein